LTSRDIGSHSDPYLIVSMGNRVYNERHDYKLDEINPFFNKVFDFNAELPGAPTLKI
jgi:hypothetical protein